MMGNGESFGDVLSSVFFDVYYSEQPNGLLIITAPTGAGKSYGTNVAIANIISENARRRAGGGETAPKRPIVYITPQKKNLSDVDLIRRACQAQGYDPGPRAILELKSIPEMLADTVENVRLNEVPEDLRRDTGVDDLISWVKFARSYPPRYYDLVRESDALDRFRKSARAILRKPSEPRRDDEAQDLTPEEIVERIKTNPRWTWLADLWPATLISEADVIICTSAKFFYPVDTLAGVATTIEDMPCMEGGIIFMDEVDAIKTDWLNQMANAAVRTEVDLPTLVRQLDNAIRGSALPADFVSRSGDRLARVAKILESTAADTRLGLRYKASEGILPSERLFVYDGTRQAVSHGTSRLQVRTDEARRVNEIVATDPEGEDAGKGTARRGRTTDRWLNREVNALLNVIRYVARTLASMVHDDMRQARTRRRGYQPTNEEIRDSINSMLDVLDIEGGQRMLMYDEVKEAYLHLTRQRTYRVRGDDVSVYSRGFSVVRLSDSVQHAHTTHLCAQRLKSSPEARLLHVAGKMLVIGMSATAEIDSPLSNFDLEYIRDVAPDLIRELPNGAWERLAAAYERQVSGYQNVDIVVELIEDETSVAAWASRSFGPRFAMLAERIVGRAADASKNGPSWVQMRYMRVANAYRFFLSHVEHGVFLCLTTAGPRESGGDYDSRLLTDLFRCVRREMKVADPDTSCQFISGSTDFQRRYDEALRHLGECGRLFVCAAYGTMATGVNPQYVPPEGMAIVRVGDEERGGKVDVVGIYLDTVTNVVPSAGDADASPEDPGQGGILSGVFAARELSWRGELTKSESERLVSQLLTNSKGTLRLYGRKSVTSACTAKVVQACGRIVRTQTKAPHIWITSAAKNAERCDPYALDGKLTNPEARRLLDAFAARQGKTPAQTNLEAQAANRTRSCAGFLANLAARQHWTEEDMGFWTRVRRDVAPANPTPTGEELRGIEGWYNWYVRVPEGVTSYWCDVKGDFRDVKVTFSGGPSDHFNREVSREYARLDLYARMSETRQYLEDAGYRLDWEPTGYMMNAAFFQNVYLGAIGETIGPRVLEARVPGLRFAEIEDQDKFESLDFVIPGTDVYADFKNWRASVDVPPGEDPYDKYRRKARRAGASHILIVNLTAFDDKQNPIPESVDGGRILSVPYLIDAAAECVDARMVREVRNWLRWTGAIQ